jgi:iron complex transport system substrate-binding protein
VVTKGGHDLNAEAILALDPTVILTDTSIGPAAVQQQLRQAGIPVVFFDPERSLKTVPEHISAVAAALGVTGPGDALVQQVQEQLRTAKGRLPEGVSPPRVAFLYLRGSAGIYLMGGPGSGADSLIESVGGVDVGKEIGLKTAFTPITSERLIEAAPDVILVMTEGLKSLRGIEGLLKLPGLAQTPAGTAKRVIDMPDTQMLSFGPRSGQTVQALSAALYPAPQ